MDDTSRPGDPPTSPPSSWRDHAACLNEDPELFFPPGTTGAAALEQAERAKQVCAICPVRDRCLGYALDTRQDYGVWGGADEDERRSMRRARARAARYRAAANGADGEAAAS